MKISNPCKPPRSTRTARRLNSFTIDSLSRSAGPSPASGRFYNPAMEMVLPEVKDGVVVCDSEGVILLANTSARQLSRQNPEGMPLSLSPEIWGELFDVEGSRIGVEQWPWIKALDGESTSHKECRLVRPDGSSSDVLFSAGPLIDLADRIVGAVATLTDISRQKREEAVHCELALERERSRMATHIHDTLSQSLTAITLQLQTTKGELRQDPEMAGVYLQRAIGLARDALAELRSCIWTLSHESLEGEDLAKALSFLTERLFAPTPVELELSLQPESESLRREIRHEILWICKEAVTNVVKHAQATKVQVELLCGASDIQLQVDDNGLGFETPRLPNVNGSFGLISMRKRAERLGGTVSVTSHPGRGTRVVAAVPRAQH